MIKKIMVPLAFSKYSAGILDYAADIAGLMGAEIHVVNVISDRDLEAVSKITSFGYKVDAEHYMKVVKEERRKELAEMTDHLTLPDERVSFTFLVGDPTGELLRYVVENDIDAVVMGVKNRDISHMFTGSVAERMFRKCPVPVISYRGEDIAERLRKRVYKDIIGH